jgi:uncharacterized protein
MAQSSAQSLAQSSAQLLANHSLRLGAIALLALSLGSSLTACGTSQAAVPGPLTQTLVVTGRGKVAIPKTIARVQLGVEVQDKTSEAVQRKLAERSAAVTKLLQGNKAVQQLQTTAVSLTPQYSYKDNQQNITGYSATNLVHFEIEPGKLNNLIDTAIQAGATRVDGVTLVATDAAIEKAQGEAIAAATHQAEQQANAALGALSLKQKKVVNIQINPTLNAQPLAYNMAKSGMDQLASVSAPAPSMPIIAGQQDIEATVLVQVQF